MEQDTCVEVLSSSANLVDTWIQLSMGDCIQISWCYGYPEFSLRPKCWDRLRHTASTMDEAWLVIGDLNEIAR